MQLIISGPVVGIWSEHLLRTGLSSEMYGDVRIIDHTGLFTATRSGSERNEGV